MRGSLTLKMRRRKSQERDLLQETITRIYIRGCKLWLKGLRV
jgi:hypothetical protein